MSEEIRNNFVDDGALDTPVAPVAEVAPEVVAEVAPEVPAEPSVDVAPEVVV
jgi:hypothetical protein